MQDAVPELRVLWDPRKAKANLRKHRVSFEESATVFNDPLSITKPDPDHSVGENRFLTLELSFKHRLVLVAHTEEPNEIRIISARIPTRSERYAYEVD
jgi:uncharacterized DUF497 family protein